MNITCQMDCRRMRFDLMGQRHRDKRSSDWHSSSPAGMAYITARRISRACDGLHLRFRSHRNDPADAMRAGKTMRSTHHASDPRCRHASYLSSPCRWRVPSASIGMSSAGGWQHAQPGMGRAMQRALNCRIFTVQHAMPARSSTSRPAIIRTGLVYLGVVAYCSTMLTDGRTHRRVGDLMARTASPAVRCLCARGIGSRLRGATVIRCCDGSRRRQTLGHHGALSCGGFGSHGRIAGLGGYQA